MRPLRVLLWSSIVLPASVIGVLSWQTRHAALLDLERQAATTAVLIREHSLRVFEAQLASIRVIDQRLADRSWDDIARSVEIHDLLVDIQSQSSHIDGVWIGRNDGFTIASADFFPMKPVDIRDREYFQELAAGGTLHLSRIRGKLKGNVNFNLSQRRTGPPGVYNGSILITSDAGYFTSYWRIALGEGDNIAAIVRNDGTILARYPDTPDGLSSIPPDSPLLRQAAADEGVVALRLPTPAVGIDRQFAAAPLSGFPVKLVVGLGVDSALASWRRTTAINALAGLLVSAALLALVRMAWRRQVMLHEEIEARRRAESTLIAKEEHLAALEKLERARRESEERFRSLFETLTQGITVLDSQGRILEANDTAATILGRSARALTTMGVDNPEWHSTDGEGNPISPTRHPSIRALTSRQVVKGQVMGVRNAETGDRRWLVVDAIPRFEAGNPDPVGVFCLFSDITQRRRGEEAQRLLVREVDHRAKNALAVVQAVIRLTKADTVKDFIAIVEGRIGALARAHTLLARNRWEGAELRTLAEEELAPYARDRNHVVVDGPALVLTADAAQPISMVLHELATNAAKYGALSDSNGRLSVSWHADPEGTDFRIDWVEDGGPPVAAPASAGFGSRLIRMNLESQLRGRVDYDWTETGLRLALIVPIEHVQSFGTTSPDRAGLQSVPGAVTLNGARVLLAEDNAPVAFNMVRLLRDLGCTVTGPAATVGEVLRMASDAPVDVAVLDIDLHGETVFPAAEELQRQGVPMLFCSGFGELAEEEGRWSDVPLLRKPVAERDLVAGLAAVLARAPQRHTMPG